MTNAISSFDALYNNPFIFAPLFVEFYKGLGRRPNSIVLSYLVLPLTLPPETRRFFKNARRSSSLHTFLIDRSRLYGLPERIERYREITNRTLQYTLDLECLQLGSDLSLTFQEHPLTTNICPADTPKAARKLGEILAPFDIPSQYRMLGIKKL